jgi:hypothetical protein
MGLDDAREGWRYRGQTIKPGSPFEWATERYRASGHVQRITLLDLPGSPTP